MKGSTKKKIRRCVICVVAFIAVYATFNLRGLAQLLAGAVLGLAYIPLVIWWDLPTDEEWAKQLEAEGIKPLLEKPVLGPDGPPVPKPLSPELTELAEKIRKKLE